MIDFLNEIYFHLSLMLHNFTWHQKYKRQFVNMSVGDRKFPVLPSLFQKDQNVQVPVQEKLTKY